MSASFETCLDVLLYGLGPAWHLVGSDRDRLISGCKDWLERNSAREGDHRDQSAESRAIWILDRLLPIDEVDTFRALKPRGSWGEGLYAFGRRAPEELASVTPEEFERDYLAIQPAWVESRERDEDLLDWYAVCRERGWPTEQEHYDGLAIREYCRRDPDGERLLQVLSQMGRQAQLDIVNHLLSEAAGSIERTREPEEDLASRLEAAGLSDLAQAWHGMVARWPRLRLRFARRLWVAQLTEEDLDALVEAEEEIPYWPTERLAEVCPKDRFDIWERALRFHQMRGNFPIRRFCCWLEPDHRDLLVPHVRRRDLDWAACAFHAHLSMLPVGVAEQFAAGKDTPQWQAAALDRFLHAPPELKPPPYVTDAQETEADHRLYDPFNVRSF